MHSRRHFSASMGVRASTRMCGRSRPCAWRPHCTSSSTMPNPSVAAAVALAAFASVAACTHERPITELHTLAGKKVTVETYNHEDVQVVAIKAPDGVTFANDSGVLPPTVVSKVTEVRHGQGALEGIGIGFLIGATTGAIQIGRA